MPPLPKEVSSDPLALERTTSWLPRSVKAVIETPGTTIVPFVFRSIQSVPNQCHSYSFRSLLSRSTGGHRLPMNKRNDSVTCAERPAKIRRESHLTKAVHPHLSMRLPGLAHREAQRLECVVAGISSMPS